MSQATEKWYQFGVNDAWVSAYTEGETASWVQMPIIASSTLDLGITEAEVRDGEGFLQTIWFHSQTARCTLICKKWAMRVLEIISGNPVSSASGVDQIHFGTSDEITPPNVRFKLKVKAEDDAGTAGYAYVYLFKAKCRFPSLGMDEVTPGNLTLEALALRASDNEEGKTLASAAYGRLDAVDTS